MYKHQKMSLKLEFEYTLLNYFLDAITENKLNDSNFWCRTLRAANMPNPTPLLISCEQFLNEVVNQYEPTGPSTTPDEFNKIYNKACEWEIVDTVRNRMQEIHAILERVN